MRLRAIGQGLARRRPDLAVRVDRVDRHLAGGIGGRRAATCRCGRPRYRPCSLRAARCADGVSLPLCGSIAKLTTVNGSLRSAAYRNRRSGLSASGMLVGDGSSAPGISDLLDQLDIALGPVERQHRDARIAGIRDIDDGFGLLLRHRGDRRLSAADRGRRARPAARRSASSSPPPSARARHRSAPAAPRTGCSRRSDRRR